MPAQDDDQVLAAGRAKCRSVCLTMHRVMEVTVLDAGTEQREEFFLQFLLGPQYVRLLVGPRWVRRQNRDEVSWRYDPSLLDPGGAP